MVRFRVNEAACRNLAAEFRRASWGVGVLGSVAGQFMGVGWVLALTATAWALLQGMAFLLDSVVDEQ